MDLMMKVMLAVEIVVMGVVLWWWEWIWWWWKEKYRRWWWRKGCSGGESWCCSWWWSCRKSVFHWIWSGKLVKKDWGAKLQVILLRKNKTITSRSPLRLWESLPVGICSACDHFILLMMQSVGWSRLLKRIFFSLGFENLLKVEGMLRPWCKRVESLRLLESLKVRGHTFS